jgi:hypothetical protein
LSFSFFTRLSALHGWKALLKTLADHYPVLQALEPAVEKDMFGTYGSDVKQTFFGECK